MAISTIGQNGLNAPITLTSPVINNITSASATNLTLQSAGTTAITVDTSQLVGIGTTSPSSYGGSLVVRKSNTGQGVTNATAQFSDATNSALWIGHTSGAANIVSEQAITFGYTNGSATTERMRITSSGFVKASNTGSYQNVSQNYAEFSTDQSNTYGFLIGVTNASYASDGLTTSFTQRTASSTFDAQRGYTSGGNVLYRIRGDGNQYTDGTYNNNGADYAEYFESANGQALTLGATVVLDGNKVREATDQDDAKNIIGVVRPKEPSKASMIVGNTAWNKWANQYLSDDFDRYIMEDHDVVEWTDEDGKKHSYESQNIPSGLAVPSDATRKTHDENGVKFQHYKINPDWNPNAKYVNRENRPEWNIIGLLGQVKLLKGKPLGDRWIKMRDVSDAVEEWFIR